ncbi:MAG: pantoate--beta-alanine ligase [Planctomycetota bacterium]|nr:pantoate--beta-alanine ligase [Planctomycetota bacterium]
MSEEARKDRLAPVVETVDAVREAVIAAKRRGLRVGFVPTMGALHAGHRSLMEAAKRDCGFVVASIFVNPTQFAPHEDLAKYPRPLDADRKLCAAAGADLVFHPGVETIYPSGFSTFVTVEGLSNILEGKFRPTHFRGVTTVVCKLFQMVPADLAFFGQKDYQQQTIIRKMVAELNIPIRIRVCPTVREPDGLALSSRNVYLSHDERRSALALNRSLTLAHEYLAQGERDFELIRQRMWALLKETPLVEPDYATLVDPDTLEEVSTAEHTVVALVAARVGQTRLIDNDVIDLPA